MIGDVVAAAEPADIPGEMQYAGIVVTVTVLSSRFNLRSARAISSCVFEVDVKCRYF